MSDKEPGERKRGVVGPISDLDEMVSRLPGQTPVADIAGVGLATGDSEVSRPAVAKETNPRHEDSAKPSGSGGNQAPPESPDQR